MLFIGINEPIEVLKMLFMYAIATVKGKKRTKKRKENATQDMDKVTINYLLRHLQLTPEKLKMLLTSVQSGYKHYT